MKHLGHISITDKVVFVYYELPEPMRRHYYIILNGEITEFDATEFHQKMKEYLASKREVEVENVVWGELCELWMFECENPLDELEGGIEVKHNQPCEAEVTDNKATITKINV